MRPRTPEELDALIASCSDALRAAGVIRSDGRVGAVPDPVPAELIASLGAIGHALDERYGAPWPVWVEAYAFRRTLTGEQDPDVDAVLDGPSDRMDARLDAQDPAGDTWDRLVDVALTVEGAAGEAVLARVLARCGQRGLDRAARIAARRGASGRVRVLLDRGADPNGVLLQAALRLQGAGRPDMELALTHGADGARPIAGLTPEDVARLRFG